MSKIINEYDIPEYNPYTQTVDVPYSEYQLLKEIKDYYFEAMRALTAAINYIWSTKYEWGDLEEDNEEFDIDVYKLLDILEKGRKGYDSNSNFNNSNSNNINMDRN